MNERQAAGEVVRARLDALVRESRIPGIQYLVVAPEETIFEHAAGWADIAAHRPMTGATTLMAYSMSKTITAAAVLQLVDAGTVRLDVSVGHYLEPCPYDPRITLRQLLSHTAGIPNPIPLAWVHPVAGHAAFDEETALEEVLRRHRRLSSTPGTAFRYSNVGYWLLGQVVSRLSGQSFTSYVTQNILRRLRILPAELAYVRVDAATQASGYLEKYSLMNLIKRFVVDSQMIGSYEDGWLHIRDHYVNGPAFGGLIGSARGFGKFMRDQLCPHSTLFSDGTRQLLYTAQHTSSGAVIPMTPGWHVGSMNGDRYFYKEGGGAGFHCMMRLYALGGIASVVMTNATGFDVGALLDANDPRFLRP